MTVRTSIPVTQIRRSLEEEHGVTMGRLIGDGYFSNCYAVKGDRSRVIKLTICDATLQFHELASQSKNPHFPKNFQRLSWVGEGKNDEGSSYDLWAYSIERLKPVAWIGSYEEFYTYTRHYTSKQVTGNYAIDSIQDCIAALQDVEAPALRCAGQSLVEAFHELKEILEKMLGWYSDDLGLDLHQHNYMMRKGGILVINDPVFHRSRID